jgi:hypothetical protein
MIDRPLALAELIERADRAHDEASAKETARNRKS